MERLIMEMNLELGARKQYHAYFLRLLFCQLDHEQEVSFYFSLFIWLLLNRFLLYPINFSSLLLFTLRVKWRSYVLLTGSWNRCLNEASPHSILEPGKTSALYLKNSKAINQVKEVTRWPSSAIYSGKCLVLSAGGDKWAQFLCLCRGHQGGAVLWRLIVPIHQEFTLK